MPQFDPTVFAPQIFWLIIVFGLFWLIMSRVGLPRVERIYKDREERIGDDLDAADRLNKEANEIRQAYEATLSSARDQAAKMIGDARSDAAKRLSDAQAEIDAKLDKQLRETEATIKDAKTKALAEMEAVAVELAKDVLEQFNVKGNTNKLKAVVKRALADTDEQEA